MCLLYFSRPRSNEPSRYELIPAQFRSDALRRFVAEQAVAPPGDNGGGLERGDLIRPIGAVLKVIHCDHPDDKTGPKLEASFEVGVVGVVRSAVCVKLLFTLCFVAFVCSWVCGLCYYIMRLPMIVS